MCPSGLKAFFFRQEVQPKGQRKVIFVSLRGETVGSESGSMQNWWFFFTFANNQSSWTKAWRNLIYVTLERQTDRSPAQQHLLGRILQWTFALRWCSGTVKLRNLTLVKHVVSERPRRELFKAFGMTHVLHQSSVQKPQQLDSNLAFYKLSFLTDSYLCMLKYYNWTRQSRPRQSPSVEEEWAQTIQTIVGSVMTEWGRSGRLEIWSLYKNSLCWSEERRREDRKCRSKERVLGCVQDYNIKQTGRWKLYINVLNTELHCESCSRKQREKVEMFLIKVAELNKERKEVHKQTALTTNHRPA